VNRLLVQAGFSLRRFHVLCHAGGAGHFSSPVWSGSVRSNHVQGAIGPASILFSKAEAQGDSAMLSMHGTIPFSMEKAWNLAANAEALLPVSQCIWNHSRIETCGKTESTRSNGGNNCASCFGCALTGYGLHAGTVVADSLFCRRITAISFFAERPGFGRRRGPPTPLFERLSARCS